MCITLDCIKTINTFTYCNLGYIIGTELVDQSRFGLNDCFRSKIKDLTAKRGIANALSNYKPFEQSTFFIKLITVDRLIKDQVWEVTVSVNGSNIFTSSVASTSNNMLQELYQDFLANQETTNIIPYLHEDGLYLYSYDSTYIDNINIILTHNTYESDSIGSSTLNDGCGEEILNSWNCITVKEFNMMFQYLKDNMQLCNCE